MSSIQYHVKVSTLPPPPFLNGCVHWAEQEKTTDISVVLILARCVEKIAFNTE